MIMMGEESWGQQLYWFGFCEDTMIMIVVSFKVGF